MHDGVSFNSCKKIDNLMLQKPSSWVGQNLAPASYEDVVALRDETIKWLRKQTKLQLVSTRRPKGLCVYYKAHAKYQDNNVVQRENVVQK
eukprot:1559956-Amphidinium_carterae.1